MTDKKYQAMPVVSFLMGVVLFASGCSGAAGPDVGSSSVGKELTQEQRFTLKDLDGNAVELDRMLAQHKAVLLNFWATWCGYCVEEMPDLIKLQEKYKAGGFTVLALNAGESPEQAASFAVKKGLNFPVLLDEDTAVAQAYGVVGIPTSYLIGSDGRLLGEYHSFTKELEADVEKALE